ncbi:MAG TPA: tripartite tricarboxylate transporter TctB family protein [Alphaproteobacteria bacterium]
MRFNDAVIGVVLMVVAVAIILYAQTFPAFPGQDYGPSLFPTVIGAALLVASAVLVVRGVVMRRGTAWAYFAPWTREPHHVVSIALVLLAVVLYIFVSDAVGFLLSSFVILATLFIWLGVGWRLALVVAIATTFVIDWFFGNLMRVPLPRGILNLIS